MHEVLHPHSYICVIVFELFRYLSFFIISECRLILQTYFSINNAAASSNIDVDDVTIVQNISVEYAHFLRRFEGTFGVTFEEMLFES